MFDASDYWITVVELDEFEVAAAESLTPEEIEGLITYVAQQPDDGEVIPDTGGGFAPWLGQPVAMTALTSSTFFVT